MTIRNRIVLVTCRQWPEISKSDAELARELERRGHEVAALPWNDAPITEFTSADLVVLRSNWDFHHHREAFDDWLTTVEHSQAELVNPAGVVREHNEKSYLHRYADLGFPVPATMSLDEFDVDAIRSWTDERGLETVVLKPAWGASGHAVERLSVAELDRARSRWAADDDHRGVIVQEFLPQIRSGELAIVFFGNEFSHALLRRPIRNDFRVNSQYGGVTSLAAEVDLAAVSLASKVVNSLSTVAIYARIDVAGKGKEMRLMEVEVNEPGLGLDLATGSAHRFADVLLGV